ncbi:hypothetical protein EDB84DRAFT_1517529 [Lactarius hengduanensis]|nr:hypothetical protein EDB84DRAFT_1517529 [Lactarius hengduanensis]
MMPAGPTASSTPSWTAKMARLLLIPDNEEGLVAPALVLKATDYWPRIFLHAVWRELQAGDNQGRRLLRVTYSGLDLIYMYEYPSAAAGEHQVTQEDFTPELRLKQLLDTLGVRRFRVPPYACTSFVVGHIMHAYITHSRVLRTCVSSGFNDSRSTFNIDPQNSSITTFRFSSADSPYSDHAQTSLGFVLTSRLLREGRPLIERVVGNPLLNSANAHSETEIDEQQSPMPRNPKRQQSLFSKTAPANSASTTLPRSPHEDVFTESRPLEHAKRPYRGELAGVQRTGTWGDIRSLPTLPTLSSDSSGSSISTLATPASPSPAPRHVRRAAQARLSLPTPTPTPAAAEPGRRRAHARMSLMFPLPTPAAESRAAYRNSLDLSELARCRLWDARDVLDKETEYVQR